MRRRIGVIALGYTGETSKRDVDEIKDILELLSKRYHFKWGHTTNPGWVRALADEMEKEKERERL